MDSYRCQCDRHKDWLVTDVDAAKCPRCGSQPARYFLNDDPVPTCYLHRVAMTDTYVSSPQFLLISYRWVGHEGSFPNAKLYAVAEKDLDPKNEITFSYCQLCEESLQSWLKEE